MSWFKKKAVKIGSTIALALSLISCFDKEAKELHRRSIESRDNLELAKVEAVDEDLDVFKKIVLQLKVSKNYEEKADELMREGNFKEAKVNYRHSFIKNSQALRDLQPIIYQIKNLNFKKSELEKKIGMQIDQLERELKEKKTQIYLKYKKARDQSIYGSHDVKKLSASNKGVDFIKGYEDFKPNAYFCQAGKCTIGFGHTKGVKPGDKIDITQATKLFQEDLEEFEGYVKKYVKVKLSQQQFDALVSLCFNIGPGNFKRSDLVKDLNKGHYDKVPSRIREWTKARNPKTGKLEHSNGLKDRREKEVDIWLNGRYHIKNKF